MSLISDDGSTDFSRDCSKGKCSSKSDFVVSVGSAFVYFCDFSTYNVSR
jgi:hypothetical protein